ncbi:MAG TPA: hypothetical protein DHN29_21530, partial [Cytophagales bacterium]|nr:hypothetical protein [Cytophagales bacterium]
MVRLYDISTWSPHPWLNTGGTRDKKFIQSPEGEYFFFKTSLLRPQKDYRYEFWNEIISFHLGQMLGFDTLKYELAIDGDKVGCLSKTMIDNNIEDLNEGGKYLQAYDNSFDPELKELRASYSFQLIEETLISFQLETYMSNILEIIVFDAIIGNSDRHQENWAFIIGLDNVGVLGITSIERLIKYHYDKVPSWLKWILRFYKDKKENKLKKQFKDVQIGLSIPKSFAPIYDNGSSLGRELLDERLMKLDEDENLLYKYIKKGKSEIHWNNQKMDHFSLLKTLDTSKYSEPLKSIIKRVLNKYDSNKLDVILNSLDVAL